MASTDHELLQRYARLGEQAAFAEIVQRHVDLVYSAARRQVRSPQLAEEVSQSVFVDLARSAGKLRTDLPIAAWLHLVTRRTAVDVIRRETRRRERERQAAAMVTDSPMKPSLPDWAQLEPLLDEAVASLSATDRAAILLRFFQNQSLREVGAALGMSEDAAQKRVSRALDQLRGILTRRGAAVTGAALATALSTQAMESAPVGLAASINTAIPSATLATATHLATTTTQRFVVGSAFALVGGLTLYQTTVVVRDSSVLAALRAESVRAEFDLRGAKAAQAAAAAKLAAVEKSIDAALADAAPTSAADAALEAQMREWMAKVDALKLIFLKRPDWSIPEMRLLDDRLWFDTAMGLMSLDTPDAERRAAARLRAQAENRFMWRLTAALKAFRREHGSAVPESTQQLQPYGDAPLDPAMLDRYQVQSDALQSSLSNRRFPVLIASAAPVDPELDEIWQVNSDGSYRSEKALQLNVAGAQRAYRDSHNGQTTTNATDLAPYLRWHLEPSVVQAYLDGSNRP